MAAKYEVCESTDGKYYFHLKAGNGKVILVGKRVGQHDEALAAVVEAKTHSGNDASFDRRTSRADEPYFVLQGADDQIIGTSEMYSSRRAMEGGISSVMKNGPDARLADLASSETEPPGDDGVVDDLTIDLTDDHSDDHADDHSDDHSDDHPDRVEPVLVSATGGSAERAAPEPAPFGVAQRRSVQALERASKRLDEMLPAETSERLRETKEQAGAVAAKAWQRVRAVPQRLSDRRRG